MNRRQRVIDGLNFKETDQVPKDLGGMRSTSISCFNYRALRKALNLEDRLPMVYDEGQMLAIPEPDVLDALDCDVAFVQADTTNAYDVRHLYKPYDYNGRLEALVLDPSIYTSDENGTISHHGMTMPKSAVVFNLPHAGQEFDMNNLYMPSLVELRNQQKANEITDRQVEELAKKCRMAREATDRATFLGGYEFHPDFIGGVANGSMLCLLEPEYVHDFYSIKIESALRNYEKIIPAIRDSIDIILAGNNDMGTQNATIISPELSNEFFMPYFRQANDCIHSFAPEMKTFLHSCGAIYEIIDYIIDAHFDILNPVQWTAGGHSYREWKDKGRNRISFWGGGVDSQHVLPLQGPEAVEKQAREVVEYMKKDGGFIFCNIHNITAEIKPENIIALYNAAK